MPSLGALKSKGTQPVQWINCIRVSGIQDSMALLWNEQEKQSWYFYRFSKARAEISAYPVTGTHLWAPEKVWWAARSWRHQTRQKKIPHHQATAVSGAACEALHQQSLLHWEESHHCEFPSQEFGAEGHHPRSKRYAVPSIPLRDFL